MKEHQAKKESEAVETFVNMEKKANTIDKMIQKNDTSPEIEVEHNSPKKKLRTKLPSKKIIPNQVRIQELLRKVTFPSMPKSNL